MAEKAVAPGDLEQQIITRALKDAQFRSQLIGSPKEAIAAMGVQLPADVQVKIIEQAPNTLYLVLPVRPTALEAKDELSEAELANVAAAERSAAGCIP